MPAILSTAARASKLRGTAAWLVVTSLLMSLLCLAHFAGPTSAHVKATHSAPPGSALIVPTTWHP